MDVVDEMPISYSSRFEEKNLESYILICSPWVFVMMIFRREWLHVSSYLMVGRSVFTDRQAS